MEETTIPKKVGFLVPRLLLVEEEKESDKKSTDVIEFTLKHRAGSAAKAPTYKLRVRWFCEGTVGEWIQVRKAIAGIWKQNSIAGPNDRVATVRQFYVESP